VAGAVVNGGARRLQKRVKRRMLVRIQEEAG
jgi:hypothetical protein